MKELKITIVQSDILWHKPEENISKITELLLSHKISSNLILLPEMFTTGFTMKPEGIAETSGGFAFEAMKQWSKITGAHIAGTVPFFENGFYYNRLLIVSKEGIVAFYDKRHLFSIAGEDKVYKAGSEKLIFELNGWKVAFFICYDLRFPVWIRNYNNSYDIAVFLANWPAVRRAHWNALLSARAIENLCYVIGVNRVGLDGNDVKYSGDSQVIDFKGEVLLKAEDRELVASLSLSRDALVTYRENFPVWKDADEFVIKL